MKRPPIPADRAAAWADSAGAVFWAPLKLFLAPLTSPLAPLLSLLVATLLALTLLGGLLFLGMASPEGTAGQSKGFASELLWTESWLDGQPVWRTVFPALQESALRFVPAMVGVLWVARLLALHDGPLASALRRLALATTGLPLFLLGYALIILINRLVAWQISAGSPPPLWFALPLGNGQPHTFTWGLELLILMVGDGALGRAVRRLRHEVELLRETPFVLAATLNGGRGPQVLRRHLRRPLLGLVRELTPLMLGSLIVLELLFLEAGAGRLLIRSLEDRDMPVVGLLVLCGLGLTLVLEALTRISSQREVL